MITLSTNYVREKIKSRPVDMHKGQAGRVLIIAGSRGMAGAAVLALRGALYSGAGLVKALVPGELFNIIQTTVPEAMCIDRDEICKGIFKRQAENVLEEKACGKNAETEFFCEKFFGEFDAVAIGPGLGVSRENHEMIMTLLKSYKGPVVIDADGLNCISQYGLNAEHNGATIITPHPGEADRLLKSCGYESVKTLGREEAARKLAKESGAIVLLKGAGTIIADGHDNCCLYMNPTGNPGMATGGSGDVLTGIITSLLAQKHLSLMPVESACTGAFIHGLAGDIAAENIGEYGMTAADIADAISMAIKELIG